MAVFKSSTSRRREVRKTIPRPRPALREMLNRGEVLWGLLLAVGFWVGASLIVTAGRAQPHYRPGQVVDRSQIAQVEFQSLDPAATDQARQRVMRETPAVYEVNDSFLDAARKSLLTLPEKIAPYETLQQVPKALRDRFGLTDSQVEAFELLKGFEHTGKATDDWTARVNRFVDGLRTLPIISDEQYQTEKGAVQLQMGADVSVRVPEYKLISVKDAKAFRDALASPGLAGLFPDPVRPLVVNFVLGSREPIFTRNDPLTQRAALAAAAAVEPVRVDYLPGQVLVPAGQRLTGSGYHLLEEHLSHLSSRYQVLSRVGAWAMVGLATLVGCLLVLGLCPRVVQNSMRGLALVALLLGTLALAWLSRPLSPYVQPAAAVGSAMLAAVILAIAYDRWFAAAIIGVQAMVIGLALNLTAPMYLAVLVGCVCATVQLREVRHRGTLIRMGMISGVVVAAGIYAAELITRNHVDMLYKYAATEAALGAAATVSIGFFALGVLPFIEKAFRVTTSMTLLELGDMNHPLLRKLAQSAPGTFNHSLQVATLAETAAESIAANSLLARVGSYYHDIGKIHKPQYFVENQAGGTNPHEKVSPAMSLLIIVGHVKNGIEMAREYNLPTPIIHLIESHHGTTLAEYFYHAATQRSSGEKPAEFEYRYPGPKPQTREAAILMICDAVESACRTMPEPNAARIEQLVHAIATKRLLDGQFDQCDITLAELKQVEQAIAKSLCALYHGRISYPEPAARPDGEKKPPLPKEPPKERAAI